MGEEEKQTTFEELKEIQWNWWGAGQGGWGVQGKQGPAHAESSKSS